MWFWREEGEFLIQFSESKGSSGNYILILSYFPSDWCTSMQSQIPVGRTCHDIDSTPWQRNNWFHLSVKIIFLMVCKKIYQQLIFRVLTEIASMGVSIQSSTLCLAEQQFVQTTWARDQKSASSAHRSCLWHPWAILQPWVQLVSLDFQKGSSTSGTQKTSRE